MLRLFILSLVICGQVSSHNVFRPKPNYSGNDNSGSISNSGDANSGINSGTINYGANSGNENFGNHNGDNLYNHNKEITNFLHHFGINYSGNDNSGFISNSGNANSGINSGTINYGVNNGNENFGNHNGNNIYSNGKTTTTTTTTITTTTSSTATPETSTVRVNEQDCACNGAIDSNNLGKCTKEAVWCYIDPESACSDSDVWTGEFGYGWTMSYQACEAQLAMEYVGECNAVVEKAKPNQTNDDNKECSCNGVVDSNNGGECIKPWVGNFWCYVDAESGCLDSRVWFGEFGFCQTYSFQACGFTNTSSVIEFDNMDNTSTSTVPYEVVTVLTPNMTILGEECSCSSVIDDDNLGECTKKTVWCYVHPDAPCNDTLVWSGQFGYGWTYSYQACEAHLALTHKEECTAELPSHTNQTDVMTSKDIEDGECSCNGDVDSNNGGECLKAWVGVLWCYVDLQSGCQDTQVWYGEFGFCETYSFQACHGFNNNKTVSTEEVLYTL